MSHCSSNNIYLLNLQCQTTINHKQQLGQFILETNLSKLTGTPKYSVIPLPELPSTPNELLSSNKTRNLYFSFNLMISSKGAIWPEFCKFWNQDIKSVKDKQKGSGKYSKVDYQVKTILRAMAISSGNHVVSKVQLKLS
jgi:hypothetical protein